VVDPGASEVVAKLGAAAAARAGSNRAARCQSNCPTKGTHHPKNARQRAVNPESPG
jgi:hypothetical protein